MRSLRAFFLLLAASLTAISGCRQEEGIEVNVVSHEEREPIRLRVGIIEHEPLVWFFRLSGPESLVKEHVESFDAFVRSVKFDDNKSPPIEWVEPKEWKKDPPGGERYAGFRIATKAKQLEISVTRLPAEGYSLRNNVHRWQKQINLPLVENADDLKQYVETEKAGGNSITWVDMKGLGVHLVSRPPEPKAFDNKRFESPFPVDKPRAVATPFQYVVPEGWVKKGPRKFAVEVFEVVRGDQVADVTLTPLAGNGGGLAMNINRWRNEVGLPKLSDDEVSKSAEALLVAGIPSRFVDLGNPKGPAAKNHTLGVIIPMEQQTWFVKMSGPYEWVSQNKSAFETFVKSFKLDAR